MNTPAKAKSLIIYIAVVWICSPLVEFIYYQTEFNRGSYPPEADTILIPIMQFTIGWAIMTPFAIAFVWWLAKRYPGRVSLLAWDQDNKLKSYAITIVLVAVAISEIWFAAKSVFRIHPADVISSLAAAHISLIVRASIIMSKKQKVLFQNNENVSV